MEVKTGRCRLTRKQVDRQGTFSSLFVRRVPDFAYMVPHRVVGGFGPRSSSLIAPVELGTALPLLRPLHPLRVFLVVLRRRLPYGCACLDRAGNSPPCCIPA